CLPSSAPCVCPPPAGLCGSRGVNPCKGSTCIDRGTEGKTCVCLPNHRFQGSYCDQSWEDVSSITVEGSDWRCKDVYTMYGLTLQQFTAMNPGIDCSALLPQGRELEVKELLPACSAFYYVQPNDTCSSVAQFLDITEESLQQLNPDVTCPSRLPAFCSLCVERDPSKAKPSCDSVVWISVDMNFKSFAAYFDVTMVELYRLNPWISSHYFPGEYIICFGAQYPDEESSTTGASPAGACGDDRLNPCWGGTCIDRGTEGKTCVCLPNHRSLGSHCNQSWEDVSSITVEGSYWRCKDVYTMYGLTLEQFTAMNPVRPVPSIHYCFYTPSASSIPSLSSPSPSESRSTSFSLTLSLYHPLSLSLCSTVSNSLTLSLSHCPIPSRCSTTNAAAFSFNPLDHLFPSQPPPPPNPTPYQFPLYFPLPQIDTCSSVAHFLNITKESLQQLNPGVTCPSSLPAFHSLCVERDPAKARPRCVNEIEIGKVVDFKQVAASNGVTMVDLCRLNPWISFRDSRGDTDSLCVDAQYVPAPPSDTPPSSNTTATPTTATPSDTTAPSEYPDEETSSTSICGYYRVNPCSGGTCINHGMEDWTCVCQPSHRSHGSSCGELSWLQLW
ncbi:unnamed protein product, partial [Closterium sp. NIES-54]